MRKKTLNKDIYKSFTKSKGRFISIFLLMLIGSFALVGLKVAGPDMKSTGELYFNKVNMADLIIIGDYGIDSGDREAIEKVQGAKDIEYGYLKDVVVKNTNLSFRVFSDSKAISKYEIVEGRMPENNDEIVIFSEYKNDYNIEEYIEFSEPKDITGNTVLKNSKFKIVGFIKSSEIISSVNMGQTTAGTGELKGYAVVNEGAFDSDIYMIARLVFKDTFGLDPYSEEYTDLLHNHKTELQEILKDQSNNRLVSIKEEYQNEIDDGRIKIEDAKLELKEAEEKLDDAKIKIADGKTEIQDNEDKLNKEVKEAEETISDGEKQIVLAENEAYKIFSEKKEYLDSKNKEYESALLEYEDKSEELRQGEIALNKAKEEIKSKKIELENGKVQYEDGIEELNEGINKISTALSNPLLQEDQRLSLNSQLNELTIKFNLANQEYAYFINNIYSEGLAKIQSGERELASKSLEIESGKKDLESAKYQLESAKKELDLGSENYNKAVKDTNSEIASKKQELNNAKEELKKTRNDSEIKLNDAKSELLEKESEYNEKLEEYSSKKADADKEISENEEKLDDAQKTLNSLEKPVYSVSTRRESPGAEGYKIYSTVSDIIDVLSNIFPIFLYFVAALVTVTTMARFVDEERINLGTLKALGYEDKDVIKKFVIYGAISSSLGTILGIVLGHTLLPLIVYNTYKDGFIFDNIELKFHLGVTLLAIILSIVSSILPAYIVAKKELKEEPSRLLLPKPPVEGSKILLERIKPIWNKLSFTHKVTARNIFRYKKRMLMTIFGVCGSVTLLFSGLGIQHSISGINERQFGEIINYDMIIAKNSDLDDEKEGDIENLLNSSDIERESEIYYEELTIEAGKNNDKQIIKLIVPENEESFNEYIRLINRETDEKIELKDGVSISERLSSLLDVKSGDKITIKDANEDSHEITVTSINEMYMGHFMFMNKELYSEFFGEKYVNNANMVTLKDRSIENTENKAEKFMELSGVKGIVQNTTLKNQIDIIVSSLDKIMTLLIIVAAILAIVILYNLTNINVSERIRELSTIKVLGFFDKEVTMYIYRETILLSLIGILVGYGLGLLLHFYIITIVPPEEVMFNPSTGFIGYIISFVIIVLVTGILGIFVNRRLRNVDMLEALKSVE